MISLRLSELLTRAAMALSVANSWVRSATFFSSEEYEFIQFCRHQVELVSQGFDLVTRFHLNTLLKLTCGHLLGGMD